MKKPKVFANYIDHKLNNNEEVFASYRGNKSDVNEYINVRKKIRDIIESPSYVYKADVIIKTNEKTIEKTIVGVNNNKLLTIDNESIYIDDILDINLKNWRLVFNETDCYN